MFLREFVLIFYAHDKCGYSAKAVTPLQVHAPLLVRRCVYFQKMIINGAFCLGEESRSYRLLRQQTNQEREQFFFFKSIFGRGTLSWRCASSSRRAAIRRGVITRLRVFIWIFPPLRNMVAPFLL